MSVAGVADLVTAILLVLVAILGLLLCAVVILTVLQNKGLRNPFTAIICFICTVHIVEYLVPLPLKIGGDLLHLDVPQWSFGEAACKFHHFAFFALAYSVAYCIVLLVLDRFFDAKKKDAWTINAALMLCAALTLAFIVINLGVPAEYGLQKESNTKGADLETCGLKTFQGVALGTFFVFSYLLPLFVTFAGVVLIARLMKIRKEFQLGDDVDVFFKAKIAIIIFTFASYAVLRLIWHLDRLLLAGGLTFDLGDLIVQDVGEILWYLHGVLVPAFVIIVYPDFYPSVRALCCGPEGPSDILSEYTSDEDLVLMPVVTTEADPDRFDTWPQSGYNKDYRGSDLSLASTTISSMPETPASPKWRIVRTLDRPQPKSKEFVQKIPVTRKTKIRPGDSSARSRSSSPASEHREDKIKSRRPKLFKKKKSKKEGALSADEAGH